MSKELEKFALKLKKKLCRGKHLDDREYCKFSYPIICVECRMIDDTLEEMK